MTLLELSEQYAHAAHLLRMRIRTLRQMERMLDGPYRMTCYPEPVEQTQEAAEPVVQEEILEPMAEQPAPVQAPSVKNLLQRVRIKR